MNENPLKTLYYVRTRVFNTGNLSVKYFGTEKPPAEPNPQRYDEYIDGFDTEQEARDFINESKFA